MKFAGPDLIANSPDTAGRVGDLARRVPEVVDAENPAAHGPCDVPRDR